MRHELDQENFYAAIDVSLDIIDDHPHSILADTLAILLAYVWDTSKSADLSDTIPFLEIRAQQLIFDLIIGRAMHGRPTNHPRRDELIQQAILIMQRPSSILLN